MVGSALDAAAELVAELAFEVHEAAEAEESFNVTLNTYGHLFPDAFADVGEALDRLVRAEAARAS